MRMLLRVIVPAVIGAVLLIGGAAYAGLGQPSPWEMGLQEAASPVMENIVWFHNFLLWIIVIITLFVLGLLAVVIVRFNAKANPVPTRTTHHTGLEIAWTIVPVIILVAIAIPSFKLLFYQQTIPTADLTVKATGKQWYWSYSYPDAKFEFDSIMLQDAERAKINPPPPRLLGVDNAMVVPVNKVVRVQVIGAEVIHSFSVPSFGIKIDAVPGRLNETWFKAEREGVYYGQCSQLCGRDHAFMPIAVRVVSESEYTAWVDAAKKKFASGEPNKEQAQPTTLAAVFEK
jgi:cytochrome c oxidase subunit 2